MLRTNLPAEAAHLIVRAALGDSDHLPIEIRPAMPGDRTATVTLRLNTTGARDLLRHAATDGDMTASHRVDVATFVGKAFPRITR